jgi:hypothetical protein
MWANWGTVENAGDQIQRQQRYFTAQMCTYGAQYAIFIFFKIFTGVNPRKMKRHAGG